MYTVPTEIEVAHRVLNLILVKLRWLVSEGVEKSNLYDILDRIEILPTLLKDERSVREFFEHVAALAATYPEFRLAAQEAEKCASADVLG